MNTNTSIKHLNCTKTDHFDAIFDQLRLKKMIKIAAATDVRFLG